MNGRYNSGLRPNSKGMVLAIDMGNTNIVIGCVDDEKVLFEERVSTDRSKTELEYVVLFKTVLELHKIQVDEIQGAIISSVVPPLVNVIKEAVEKLVGVSPMIVGPGIKTGLNILMDQPRQLGSDLVVDAVAAINGYGTPAIIIDIGTATTMSVVDRNGNYIGGLILPGVKISLDSLVSGTSQLPRISLEAPGKVIGKNTIHCMQSGVVYGYASCIDGLIERLAEEMKEPLEEINVIATGGLSSVIVKECHHNITIDQELLLKGLKIIYDKNVE